MSWRRNVIILCLAQLLTMIGFSAYLPFLPYYVQELGVTDSAQVMSWVAWFNSGSAIAMMIFAPIWGGLSDRYGRKLMLVRATLAGTVLAFLMGLTRSPSHLVVLRILQGVFCGTVSAALTLVATETPEESLGWGLGLMQTAQFVGQSLGPVVGGVAADALGYRAVFPIASALMAISLSGIVFLVHEHAKPLAPRALKSTLAWRIPLSREALQRVNRNAAVLILALAVNSFAAAVLSPVLSLFIQSLSGSEMYLGTWAGSITAIAALTSSAAALVIGPLGDKWGQKRVLLACVIAGALIHVPQAWVTSTVQLLVLRAIQGIFMGGIMPTANALLAQTTDISKRGTVFGLSASAQAGGRAVGPLAGAAVAGIWGMASAFWVTAALLGSTAALVGGLVRAPAHPDPAASPVCDQEHARAATPTCP